MDYGKEGRAVEHAFIAPYGQALVVVLDDGQVQIIRLEEEMAATLRLPFDFLFQENAVSVQPDRILFAEYSAEVNGNITLWQVTPGTEAVMAAAISEMDAFVTSLAFSPDGGTLAVGFNLGEIRLYRTRDGARLRVIKAFNDFVMSMAYSQDGRYIIADSLSFDPNTYVFDAKNGGKVATLSTESWEPGRVSISMDGTLAAATASDGTHIFTTGDWRRAGAVIAGVWEGTFTCDGRGFMLARGGQVDVYSLADGLYVETLDGGPFYCLADGRMVAIVLDYGNNVLTLRLVTGLEKIGIES
jgi:DNA-binding beta-propeller fold protein YncE